MNCKNVCLCLIVILTATWADRLATGTFLIAPPTGTPFFGEEIYTVAMRERDKNVETIEAPPSARLDSEPFSIPSVVALVIRLEKAIPRRLSSAEARYLLMSLQR